MFKRDAGPRRNVLYRGKAKSETQSSLQLATKCLVLLPSRHKRSYCFRPCHLELVIKKGQLLDAIAKSMYNNNYIHIIHSNVACSGIPGYL